MNLDRPKVVVWFKVYCWVLAALYFLVMLFSMMFFMVSPESLEMDAVAAMIIGGLLLAMGAGLLVVSLLGVFLTPRPWVWVYSLVLICLGMTSACFIPFCVVLLLYWLKEETKAHYGMLR